MNREMQNGLTLVRRVEDSIADERHRIESCRCSMLTPETVDAFVGYIMETPEGRAYANEAIKQLSAERGYLETSKEQREAYLDECLTDLTCSDNGKTKAYNLLREMDRIMSKSGDF